VCDDSAPPVSLREQLAAQYKLVKVGNAAGELTILEPGAVVSIQKGEIVGVIPKSVAICTSKFEGGNLKARVVFAQQARLSKDAGPIDSIPRQPTAYRSHSLKISHTLSDGAVNTPRGRAILYLKTYSLPVN
jgi:hypothetical protein